MSYTVTSSIRSLVNHRPLVNARTFRSTPVAVKTIKEKVFEAADNANKKVGEKLASALETGEKATQTTKDTLGVATEPMKKKADEVLDDAGRKANQAAKDNLHDGMKK